MTENSQPSTDTSNQSNFILYFLSVFIVILELMISILGIPDFATGTY